MHKVLILLIAIIFMSSCSSPEEEVGVEEEGMAVKQTTREAVYVYSRNGNKPSKVSLNFANEPLPLSCGYVRLVGVVGDGGGRIALLEIGGRGLIVRVGDKVDNYIVSTISEKGVVLCLKK